VIHLALSILAFLFLAGCAIACASLIFVLLCQWQTWAVLGTLVVVGIVAFDMLNERDKYRANKAREDNVSVVIEKVQPSKEMSPIVSVSTTEDEYHESPSRNEVLPVVPASTTEDEYHENPSIADLRERLNSNPPLEFVSTLGRAVPISILSLPQDGIEIVIYFDSIPINSLSQDKASSALTFLRDHFCGYDGLLKKYRINPNYLMLKIYEGDNRIGLVSLPVWYCS
jgi:hypothetical protein